MLPVYMQWDLGASNASYFVSLIDSYTSSLGVDRHLTIRMLAASLTNSDQ